MVYVRSSEGMMALTLFCKSFELISSLNELRGLIESSNLLGANTTS